MSYGVGCRRGLDPELLWLWHRPAATAPITPLAWKPPYAGRAAQEISKRQKKKCFKYLVNSNLFKLFEVQFVLLIYEYNHALGSIFGKWLLSFDNMTVVNFPHKYL